MSQLVNSAVSLKIILDRRGYRKKGVKKDELMLALRRIKDSMTAEEYRDYSRRVE